MRSASVSRFSRAPSSHSAVIRPAARRPSPYRTSKPMTELEANNTIFQKTKAKNPTFDDKIIMINKRLTSFSELEYESTTRSVDVKKNQIKSFLGLPALKELESLDISYNPITNFSGFPHLPKLRAITLTNTPLVSNRNYKIALIILVGSTLRLINGERISASDRRFAASFPAETPTLLHLGWDISGQPPSPAEVPKIIANLTTITAAARPSISSVRKQRKASVTKKLSVSVSSKLSQQEEEKRILKSRIAKLNKKK